MWRATLTQRDEERGTDDDGLDAAATGAAIAAQFPDQSSADAADLQASLADQAGLRTGSRSLDDVLASVATYAAHAIPGADGAGITLLRVEPPTHSVEALAASHPFVAEIDAIDEIQYVTLNEGPCITAALEDRTVRSGSLGGEMMWPRLRLLGETSSAVGSDGSSSG